MLLVLLRVMRVDHVLSLAQTENKILHSGFIEGAEKIFAE